MCLTNVFIILIMAVTLGFAFKLPSFVTAARQNATGSIESKDAELQPYVPTAIDLVALPAALLFGFAFASSQGIAQTLGWVISIPFHEGGHALMWLLQGVLAVPWILFTIVLGERSFLVSIIVIAANGALSYFAMQYKRYVLSALGLALVALAISFSLVLPSETGKMVAIYGGLGGEIYLSAVAMVLFFERYRSDKTTRYILLIMGAFCFSGAVTRWSDISTGAKKLPMGAALDFQLISTGESGGDLDVLMREFNWTHQNVIDAYITTGWCSAGCLLSFYIWQIIRYRNRDSGTDSTSVPQVPGN